MKIRTTIGTTEKHEVEAEQSWLGKRKVIVDGDDIIDKREITSLSGTVRFAVGEEEKHECKVRFGRGISGLKVDIYADGKLIARS